MSSLGDFIAAFPEKFIAATVVGIAFFLVYFLVDSLLYVTKRRFGRVNIELVHFTRNDYKPQWDALHFRTMEASICLKQVYDNRFLFWKVIYRSMKATPNNPVVNFGAYTYAALVPFRDRVAAKCSVGEIKRAHGLPFSQMRRQLVVVNDVSEYKRRRILKVLVIREEDLRKLESYLNDPPKTGNFELFVKVARVFQENPGAFLPVQTVAPA